MGFVVRDGNDVGFWLDDWLGVGPLRGLFHVVFRVVFDKESIVCNWIEVTDS